MLRLEKAAQLMRQNFHKVKMKVNPINGKMTNYVELARSMRRQSLSSGNFCECELRRTFYTLTICDTCFHVSR